MKPNCRVARKKIQRNVLSARGGRFCYFRLTFHFEYFLIFKDGHIPAVIPIPVQRPLAAGRADGFFPPLEALGALSLRIEGMPLVMATGFADPQVAMGWLVSAFWAGDFHQCLYRKWFRRIIITIQLPFHKGKSSARSGLSQSLIPGFVKAFRSANPRKYPGGHA